MTTSPARRLVILSGRSGSGVTTARGAFQDQGFHTIDNLPIALLEPLLAQDPRPLVLTIDARTSDFSAQKVIDLLRDLNTRPDLKAQLVFLDCDDGQLLQRFSETRRVHPLAADRPVIEGLKRERELLEPLKNRADLRIDTTSLSSTELRHLIGGHFPAEAGRGMMVHVMSFSYRHGVPQQADLVLDARFLRNPHYDPVLRPQTGQDEGVGDYICADQQYAPYLNSLTSLLSSMLPGLKANDRAYFTIAFGCTGGKHRSVYLAETIGNWLNTKGYPAEVSHRELERLGLARKAGYSEATRRIS